MLNRNRSYLEAESAMIASDVMMVVEQHVDEGELWSSKNFDEKPTMKFNQNYLLQGHCHERLPPSVMSCMHVNQSADWMYI
jgi:hypothetical protein